jgi:hypothetical protein
MRIHGRIWRLRELDEDSWEDLEIAGARSLERSDPGVVASGTRASAERR